MRLLMHEVNHVIVLYQTRGVFFTKVFFAIIFIKGLHYSKYYSFEWLH